MRRYLYRIFGGLIILTCAISAGLWSMLELALFVSITFGFKNHYSNTLTFAAILTLPLLAYFWWAWTRHWSIDAIKALLDYEED